MANYSNLILQINNYVKQNGMGLITGDGLQSILDAMVASLGAGALFKGKATPPTSPGTPDSNVFYIAEAGTYDNFGGAVIPEDHIGFLAYNGSWTVYTLRVTPSEIDTDKIADGAVTSPKVADGAITNQKLANGSVNANKIADGSVGSSKIADGAVGTAKVADNAITAAKLAAELSAKLFSTGFKFLGVATPSTNPSTPDQYAFYIGGPGTYRYLMNTAIPQGAIGIFLYTNSWSAVVIDIIALVNDLTTGGVDKALTAEQGKVLAQSITQLNETLTGEIGVVGQRVTSIEYKIPAEATSQNKLADKNYVLDHIREWSADFKGTYNSYEDLAAVTADKNDYGYVLRTDAAGNSIYDRYIYNGTAWVYQYSISSPIFSTSEWNAIRSGITQALVAKLDALPNNATLQQALEAINARFTDYTKTVDLALIATSGLLEDATQDPDHRTVTDAEKADWNDKAEKAGDYPLMAAGSAEVIEGTTPVAGEYTFRPSGGGASRFALAMIDKIKGKSLVWNQYLKNGNFADGTTNWFSSGGDIAVSDGVLSFTMTSVPTAFYNARVYQVATGLQSVSHKYLITVDVNFERTKTPTLFIVGVGGNPSYNFPRVTARVWTSLQVIYTPTGGATSMLGEVQLALGPHSGDDAVEVGDVDYIKNFKIIDLTQMFGEGHEPATVAEFNALYGAPYYAANAGKIVNNKTAALESVGYNQYDPATGKAKVIGGQQYYIGGTYTSLSQDGETITPVDHIFTPAYSGEVVVVGGNDSDTIINLSDASRNGEYQPYKRSVINLNLDTITGKLNGEGESVVICADGMRGVGTAFDEGLVENGYFNKVNRKFIEVDLGDLNWTNTASVDHKRMVTSDILDIVKRVANNVKANILCTKYVARSANATYVHIADKIVAVGDEGNLYVYDSDYITSDGATFKTAMAGVKCIIEIATPQVYVLDNPIFVGYLVSKNGTERRLPEDTASVVNAPFACDVIYPLDLGDYLSKAQYEASQKDMLEAQKSAGLISAYTMAWDESQQKFVYTITV